MNWVVVGREEFVQPGCKTKSYLSHFGEGLAELEHGFD